MIRRSSRRSPAKESANISASLSEEECLSGIREEEGEEYSLEEAEESERDEPQQHQNTTSTPPEVQRNASATRSAPSGRDSSRLLSHTLKLQLALDIQQRGG